MNIVLYVKLTYHIYHKCKKFYKFNLTKLSGKPFLYASIRLKKSNFYLHTLELKQKLKYESNNDESFNM